MAEELCLEVDIAVPCRLDVFLSESLEIYSRTKLKAWCSEGLVAVNGKPRKGSFIIRSGDEIIVQIPDEPRMDRIIPEDIPLDVVYEDADVAVINKPAGMVVHPGAGVFSGTLVHALAFRFESLSTLGGGVRPGIVHRLDKGTSGLIVVAKTDLAHMSLSTQWQNRQVTKVYQALVWGLPDPDQGVVSTQMGRNPKDPKRMAAVVSGGKEAISRYKTVETYHEAAKINVHILTGRTHQIRVHMAHLGYPVVGDGLYGGRIHHALMGRFQAMPDWPMLHAGLLRFRHPIDDEVKTFKLKPPDAFLACAHALSTFPYS